MTEIPQDADGNRLCLWCGTSIYQAGIGRRRDYCRRSCRQRAYEARMARRQVAAALGLFTDGHPIRRGLWSDLEPGPGREGA
jgi:hypothetical protein